MPALKGNVIPLGTGIHKRRSRNVSQVRCAGCALAMSPWLVYRGARYHVNCAPDGVE